VSSQVVPFIPLYDYLTLLCLRILPQNIVKVLDFLGHRVKPSIVVLRVFNLFDQLSLAFKVLDAELFAFLNLLDVLVFVRNVLVQEVAVVKLFFKHIFYIP
jgi:hypothetical protein